MGGPDPLPPLWIRAQATQGVADHLNPLHTPEQRSRGDPTASKKNADRRGENGQKPTGTKAH